MASAASPTLKLPRPSTRVRKADRAPELLAIAALFVYMAAAVSQYPAFGFWAHLWGTLGTAVLLASAWAAHLENGKQPRVWCLAMSAALTWFLANDWLLPTEDWQQALASLGSAIFIYAMIWVFAAHEREPGLQPLATAALVLSIGVVAKPAIVAGCTCLSLVVFLDQRRNVGGWWRSTLLVLTPVLLCAALLGMLNSLWAGGFVGVLWGSNSTVTLSPPSPYRLWPAGPQVLWFALAAFAGRSVERKTGTADLAYLFLVVFAGTIGTASWMPHRLTTLDVRAAAAAGACSLIAISPPRSWFGRLLTLAGVWTAIVTIH